MLTSELPATTLIAPPTVASALPNVRAISPPAPAVAAPAGHDGTDAAGELAPELMETRPLQAVATTIGGGDDGGGGGTTRRETASDGHPAARSQLGGFTRDRHDPPVPVVLDPLVKFTDSPRPESVITPTLGLEGPSGSRVESGTYLPLDWRPLRLPPRRLLVLPRWSWCRRPPPDPVSSEDRRRPDPPSPAAVVPATTRSRPRPLCHHRQPWSPSVDVQDLAQRRTAPRAPYVAAPQPINAMLLSPEQVVPGLSKMAPLPYPSCLRPAIWL